MAEEIQVVVFKLASETYAIEIAKVKEIIVMQSVTGIPCTSEFIEGILNLRGHVIPIFNLRRRFGLREEETTKNSRMIVVEVNGNTVGMAVNSVSEVLRIPLESIEKTSEMITYTIDEDFIEGIAKLEEGLIILLNLEKVLPAAQAEVLAAG